MKLYKVLINIEMTGSVLVMADTAVEAERKAVASLDAPGWNDKGVQDKEWVKGTEMVLTDSAEVVGEVIT